MSKFDIDAAVAAIGDDVIEWRHYLHQNPELSNREEGTAAYIVDRLKGMGFTDDDITTGVAGHGVLALLRGGQRPDGDVRNMFLRADIDALPIKEESDLDFKSTVVMDNGEGGTSPVSHACGHDCHIAMLLGAAKILHEHAGELPGDVTFCFQPAEEGAPGDEEGGAGLMIRDDAVTSIEPRPTMAFGIHVVPGPKGWIAYSPGVSHASSERVDITFTGQGVHGSTPWAGRDPMPAVGAFLAGYQQIYREMPADGQFTISFGHVTDTGRFNVVPETAVVRGTVRCIAVDMQGEINERLERFATGIAQAYGVQADVVFKQQVPAVVNKQEWVDAVVPSLETALNDDAKMVKLPPTLGYDDVSEFINAYGGVYVNLGVQDVVLDEKGLRPEEGGRGLVPNHNPGFYADDASLLTGVKMHLHVALDHLNGGEVA